MERKITRDYKQYLMIITFKEGSEICEYYKMVGNAERWHDVSIALLTEWASGHGYKESQDLFDFLEEAVTTENSNDLVSFIERTTPIKGSWVSGF